jgi:hypothetical protein
MNWNVSGAYLFELYTYFKYVSCISEIQLKIYILFIQFYKKK